VPVEPVVSGVWVIPAARPSRDRRPRASGG
jgi:hypothetical protein